MTRQTAYMLGLLTVALIVALFFFVVSIVNIYGYGWQMLIGVVALGFTVAIAEFIYELF